MCDDFMYDVMKGLVFVALILIVDLNCCGNCMLDLSVHVLANVCTSCW